MRKYPILFYLSLAATILVLYLLFTGSSVLLFQIIESPYLPAGTPLTWLGLLSFTTAFLLGFSGLKSANSKAIKFCYMLFKIAFIMAILWLPISIGLSGNLSNSFGEKTAFQGGQLAMKIFWVNSYLPVVLPLISTLLYLIIKLIKKFKN